MLKKNAEQFMRDREFLAKAINEVRNEYDYVLIDCPPNLYLMTQNALIASDYYIVTAIPDHLSTIGLNILINKVDKIDTLVKHTTVLAGGKGGHHSVAKFGAVLFVRVRIGGAMQTTAHRNKMEEVRSSFRSGQVLRDKHNRVDWIHRSRGNSLPVWLHDSANARRAMRKQEYPKIVDELLGKF